MQRQTFSSHFGRSCICILYANSYSSSFPSSSFLKHLFHLHVQSALLNSPSLYSRWSAASPSNTPPNLLPLAPPTPRASRHPQDSPTDPNADSSVYSTLDSLKVSRLYCYGGVAQGCLVGRCGGVGRLCIVVDGGVVGHLRSASLMTIMVMM